MPVTKEKSTKNRRRTGPARDRIFDAAVELVCAGGPGAASARAICQKAKITAPTLYYYFDDLYQLYNEVLELMYVPEMQAHPGKEFTDPRGMIDYMWQRCVGIAFTEPGLVELTNEMVSAGKVPDCMMKLYARLENSFLQISRHEKLNCAPEMAAAMFWSAATGLATRIATSSHGVAYPAGTDEMLKQAVLKAIFPEPKMKAVTKKKSPSVRAKAGPARMRTPK